MFRILVVSFAFLHASGALAHHSVSSLYDYTNVRKLEGTLLSIKWVNPHVQLKIEMMGENGEAEVWQLEASAVNLLRRLGVDENAIKTGDTVVATGPVSGWVISTARLASQARCGIQRIIRSAAARKT